MVAERASGSPGPTDRIGKYEIIAKIGQGAMGEVYKARDTVLDRFVAIKTMSAAVMGNPEMGERFLREARSAARLNHPNVVTLHEFGEDAGRFFMAMELLIGEDLSRVIKRGGIPTLEEKLAVMGQILDGVAYAHAAGVIHRDLKPPNIHVQPNGHVKVMDFGLARLGEADITRTGTVMGTPNYMSPEQVRGERTGPASDVFALGSVFYELIGGRRAFDADSIHAILFKVVDSEPTPLNELCADLPPIVVAFIWRALAKKPDQRYADAGQMREAFSVVRRVLGGSVDEAEAIKGLAEAPTIFVTPSGEAATVVVGNADAQSTVVSGGTRGTLPAPSPTGGVSSLQPGSRLGATVVTGERTPPKAPAREGDRPASTLRRLPLLYIGAGAIAVVVAGAFILQRLGAPADRQAQAMVSVAVEAQISSARRSLEFKDPEGAMVAAQKALGFDPDNAEAKEIMERARTAIEEVETLAGQARQEAQAGDLDAASKTLSSILLLMPKHPVATELQEQLAGHFKERAEAGSQAMKQSAEAARRAGASSLRSYADGSAQAGLGEAAYGRKQYTEATVHFAEAQRSYQLSAREAQDLAQRRAAAAAAAAAAVTPPPVRSPTPAPTVVVSQATPIPTRAPVAAAPVATPPPAPPVPKPTRDDDAAVRQVIASLKRAIEEKDLTLYKKLRPDLTPDEERRLRDAFRNVASQELDYRIDSIELAGDKATARVTRTGRVAGQAVPPVRQVLSLVRSEAGWVITEIGQ